MILRNKIQKSYVLIFLFLLLPTFLLAQERGYTVSGKIYHITKASVYIMLTDEATSKVPFMGIKKKKVNPTERDLNKGYISFLFYNIPPGTYGIRCFEDRNDNGELDKGFFGPLEPWGLSWNETKSSGWPSFENFNFLLTRDKHDIIIYLNQ